MDSDIALALHLEKYNRNIETIRQTEYPQLQNHTYLDHAGTTLYSKSLITQSSHDLENNIFGNPHSDHRPSKLASVRVEDVRRRTLEFFNADPEHFDLVFVANASAAIKLVGDCFRDAAYESKKGFWYGYHRDCHTSLVGLRESTKGRHHCFSNDSEVAQWISGAPSASRKERKERSRGQLGLFAYPGQSNMTGRRLPLQWPGMIRNSSHGENMYTLFDAAALATTAPLDFSDHLNAPDFTCVSFYKIFGYPNLGALIVRKASGSVLTQRKNFYGGTVDMVISVDSTWHAKKEVLHDRLEDGTLPFHAIIILGHALDTHLRIYGSMKQVSQHTAYLTRLLYENLASKKHQNGRDVAFIYNDLTAIYGNPYTQGATIAFNLVAADGSVIGYSDVERLADKQNIYVRSGSLCNPGGFATYMNWSAWEMKAAYDHGHRCSDPTQIVMGKPTGVVRVSLGAMSNLRDVKAFLDFVDRNYVNLSTSSAIDVNGVCSVGSTPTVGSFESNSDDLNMQLKALRTQMSESHLDEKPAAGRKWTKGFAFVSSRPNLKSKPSLRSLA